jgi:tryprostatin B 6-hydroxylase
VYWKNLALLEMRLMTAHLVSIYEIAIAPVEDGTELLKLQDHFTVALNPLHLVFYAERRVINIAKTLDTPRSLTN